MKFLHRKFVLMLLVFSAMAMAEEPKENIFKKVLCVGDISWKTKRPKAKNYGVEIYVLPDSANEWSFKNALYKTVVDSMDIWKVVVKPGSYKFVASFFNLSQKFNKEENIAYYVFTVRGNTKICVIPTIEIGE